MAPLDIIKSSFGLIRQNALSIAVLCLPVLLVEMLLRQLIRSQLGDDTAWAWSALINTGVIPLYAAFVILTLEARSRDEQLGKAELLSIALRRWPYLAALSALNELLYILGDLPFMGEHEWRQLMFNTFDYLPTQFWQTVRYLPYPFAIWLMIRLTLCHCLVLLRGRNCVAAIRESFLMMKGEFWRVVGCILWVFIPYLLATYFIMLQWPGLYVSLLHEDILAPQHGAAPSMIMLWSESFVLKILVVVVSFRLFTLIAGTQTRMPYR
ncbi:hypothetical protein ALP94_01646 [Pseudomonas savastanoi pv. glycinea]|uniref:hypothetical protein n=1 Tax=Pseudomonas quasicaspiana TaxID=2829821 RepID=UPI000424FB0A|nr:hypothetical protein [Pseudomonas quasicaspiana]MCD5989701.1 hypothetical protein [Pseudomonas quasicaspiana]MCQ3033431.1 hypothetical protein [Pseudomonas syringae]MDG6401569.1 hypothetical protein [Pseudomonas quasicaspiana]RMR06510.1 hypothetical protein ALP94_01646 [Pseudomonas savastanoi pv. glycinea]